jgi:2-polyprenyl-6-methoxyphenol hydroxylase-like FAD-dependent oxidoreductase
VANKTGRLGPNHRQDGRTGNGLAGVGGACPTLELYEQLGLAEPVVAKGYTVPGFRLWIGGREAARVPFEEIVSDLTPYGFLHIFPQDEHERVLIDRLQDLGVQVERSTELLGYSDEGDHIGARLRGADGAESTVTAAFIAGCDGAKSKVREIMGTGFPGGTYPQIFYVADVTGEGPPVNGDLDDSDFLAVFPLADKGRVRLIGAIKPSHGTFIDNLTFEDVSDRAAQNLKLEVEKVNWFSVYHVHHRVTDRFRQGRAFVLGDAAHIHTPVGGQGMNTGIGDAINLAWKLQAVLTGRATDALLDTFEAERRAFRSAPGANNRPLFQCRGSGRSSRRDHSHAGRADRPAADGQVRGGSRIYFPHHFANHVELPRHGPG